MANPSAYSSVYICTIFWEKNDFKISANQSVEAETDLFKDWAEKNLNAKSEKIKIPTEEGNGSENFLLKQLQAFYTTIQPSKDKSQLVIIVYSGHGTAELGPESVTNLKYTPHEDHLKDDKVRGTLWYDADPKGNVKPRILSGACVDWGWIMTQLKIPEQVDHWIIYNSCFSGTALFPGPFTPGKEVPGPELKNAILYSMVAVSPVNKARTGPTSFLKVVLEAAKKTEADASGDGFTIAKVWKNVSAQSGFQQMIGVGEKLQKMTDEELDEWFEQPIVTDGEKIKLEKRRGEIQEARRKRKVAEKKGPKTTTAGEGAAEENELADIEEKLRIAEQDEGLLKEVKNWRLPFFNTVAYGKNGPIAQGASRNVLLGVQAGATPTPINTGGSALKSQSQPSNLIGSTLGHIAGQAAGPTLGHIAGQALAPTLGPITGQALGLHS